MLHSIRPWLLIGGYRASRDASLLRLHGVSSLLQLESAIEHPSVSLLYLPITDGEPLDAATLRRGVEFVLSGRERGAVLVACAAGISRSVSFGLAALAEAESIDLLAAYQSILAAHPQALPHPALWDSLCAALGQDAPYAAVVAAYFAARR